MMIRCRVCHAKEWEEVLSLGSTPLANSYLRPEDLSKPEGFYPLHVVFCRQCGLVSLDTVIDPHVLYDTYSYLSSESKTMLSHNAWVAQVLAERVRFGPQHLVVEIGSNTGTQLRFFQQLGASVLGVEPAANIAQLANAAGIETQQQFFTTATAAELVARYGRARLILGRHVFAHVDDLDDLLQGVLTLLEDNGLFAIEVPYLVDLVEHNQFDTIYHEHLSYFSVGALQTLFRRHGLEIFSVNRVEVHGGSILVLVKRASCKQFPVEGVDTLIALEAERGLQTGHGLRAFAKRVIDLKARLVGLVTRLKRLGKQLAGYGATAKGNTLLNYCGIDATHLEYVTDTTPTKQGRYLPGSRIPIRPEAYAREHPVDCVLLLAWNYAKEILEKERAFLGQGGRFIIPIPRPRIVGRSTMTRQFSWSRNRSRLAKSTVS